MFLISFENQSEIEHMEVVAMAKQANKTLIGAFVVGAVILAVVGVMIFASGQFLAEKNRLCTLL